MNSRPTCSDCVPRTSGSSTPDAGRPARRARSRLGVALALLALTAPLAAQGTPGTPPGGAVAPIAPGTAREALPNLTPEPGGGTRTVEGQVVRPGEEAPLPVVGTWVTLHRVGRDRAGPLDSTRTDAEGRYRFTYRLSGSADAVYFVSASFAGIAYFTNPLVQPRVEGQDAEIQVFDTTSRNVQLNVRGRHIVVGGTGGGTKRAIIEVFELSNDSARTLIPAGPNGATFRMRLPANATEFKVAQGDIPADAVSFVEGEVLVAMPITPGLKRLSFAYALDADAFPLRLPVQFATGVLEVLAEDPQATVTATKVAETAPATLDGRNFRRFVGNDVPANAVLELGVPGSGVAQRTRIVLTLLGGIGVVMLISLARAFSRRAATASSGVTGVHAVMAADREAERLARRIADLDAKFERERAPSDEARAQYQAERQRLKQELTATLVRRDTAREA